MDFAVDQIPVRSNPVDSSGTPPRPARMNISDVLLQAKPVRWQSKHVNPVEVRISDVYEKDGHLLVHYTLFNYGADTYAVRTPEVFQLHGVRAMQSLYGLTNFQLSDEQASKLKVERRVPVKVIEQALQSEKIAPGASASGTVSFEVASSSEHTVLSFEFPTVSSRSGRPIAAYLVR